MTTLEVMKISTLVLLEGSSDLASDVERQLLADGLVDVAVAVTVSDGVVPVDVLVLLALVDVLVLVDVPVAVPVVVREVLHLPGGRLFYLVAVLPRAVVVVVRLLLLLQQDLQTRDIPLWHVVGVLLVSCLARSVRLPSRLLDAIKILHPPWNVGLRV